MSNDQVSSDFELLLGYLKNSRGFDFNIYKRSTLQRRIDSRMRRVNINSYNDYMDYLEVHPNEFVQLFNTVLINVTGFFRDPSAWDYLAEEIIPRIIAQKQPNEPIRVWSAGCASGEEAYTLAMLFCEALGTDGFRDRVKIYATDLDEEALHKGRLATYTAEEVKDIPDHLLAKYFELRDSAYTFLNGLRRSVIFGRHDLVSDAPISRIDLLVCRNTLMYFNAEAQARIMARFHYALNDNGYLFLGKAETLLSQSSTFTPADLKRRIFVKVRQISLRDRFLLAGNTGSNSGIHLMTDNRIRELIYDTDSVAQIVVDQNGCLLLANQQARLLLNLNLSDIGRTIQELELPRRPVDLRPYVVQSIAERRPTIMQEVEWPTPSGDIRWMDIRIQPLIDSSNGLLGVKIAFTDMTFDKRLQDELIVSRQELETAYEELQSTNEELETTNEELQSTVEELEATNEELQATNEELETMNEELQSTNEELGALNEELRVRTNEVNEMNSFLEAILTSLHLGVVVADREMRVIAWNRAAEDLWGLRADEARGKHLLNLDIGMSQDQLRQPIRDCLTAQLEGFEVVVDAINRRGKSIKCEVRLSPLILPNKEVHGVILLMQEVQTQEGEAAERL